MSEHFAPPIRSITLRDLAYRGEQDPWPHQWPGACGRDENTTGGVRAAASSFTRCTWNLKPLTDVYGKS